MALGDSREIAGGDAGLESSMASVSRFSLCKLVCSSLFVQGLATDGVPCLESTAGLDSVDETEAAPSSGKLGEPESWRWLFWVSEELSRSSVSTERGDKPRDSLHPDKMSWKKEKKHRDKVELTTIGSQ